MTDYKIVSGAEISFMQEILNEYFDQGYVLAGGLSVASSGKNYHYFQAIYKPHPIR